MKIQRTRMLTQYFIKLTARLSIFIAVLVTYLINKPFLYRVMTKKFTQLGLTPLHLLWAVFMGLMLIHLFPGKRILTMALRKRKEENFKEAPNYSELELLHFVQRQNISAWRVLLVWLSFNCFWGLLYLFHIVDNADLLMLTVFYFLCDYICILFFCPFQTLIMKNKCCVNCRIYDWGHFMMFTPMLFIRNFYSWSLFFTSVVVLIHWEIIYAKYPERFWFGSNQNLQCAHCKDKTCQVKQTIKEKIS
ncbi:MAG: hypothetical protein K6G64_10425 [Eubacterium sp.]|nr:hypothetical protein [Eubacterium sp.]